MFSTDSFLDNKKLSFNQNVWCDQATMQQDVLLHFWVIFLYENMKKIFCCPALELFHCLPPLFLSTPVENSEATWKKLQNATNYNVSQPYHYSY